LNFFVRSNYPVAAREGEHREAFIQRESLKTTTQELLILVEQAIATLDQEDGAEAALRALWASLLEIKALCECDPGIRMAAQDLYDAAAAVVMDKPADAGVVDIRRWRLLKEADARLRRRLANGSL
jgi:hypothetical protein